jgi:hypothetical protein
MARLAVSFDGVWPPEEQKAKLKEELAKPWRRALRRIAS